MIHRFVQTLTNAFPYWVLGGTILALVHPPLFAWFAEGRLGGQSYVVLGLGIVMLGMGMTLRVEDFKDVLRMPRAVAAGFVAQYTIMPFLGWAVAKAMDLPPAFAAGVILVACCPGGTSSNVVTYLARAHVALSVIMTTCSTLAAVVMTPLLTQWLAGAYVPVDGWGLFLSTLQVVLLPVLAGLALHHFFPRTIGRVTPFSPLVAVLFITLICSGIIASNAAMILRHGLQLATAVFLLHAGGFGLGYLFAALLGYGETIRRTISIEVGMQNSGLGVVLAREHFSDPLTAAPCALSSVFHCTIGSLLAAWWRRRPAASGSETP
jgi:BASS family bile acid:Na+ symporter